LPDILRLKGFEFQNFAGQETGTGRASVAGTIELTENTYVEDAHLLRSELASRGFNGSEMGYYAARLQLPLSAYRIVGRQGTIYPFRGELHYTATVDGYALSGGLAHDSVPGNPLRALSPAALVAGSVAFEQVVVRFVETKNSQSAALQAARSATEARIRGHTLTGSFRANWEDTPPRFVPKFVMRLSDSIVWTPINGNPTRLEFRIQGTAQWLQEGGLANSHFRRGQIVPIHIEGSTYDVMPGDIGSSDFIISVPSETSPGEFYTTGDQFTWREGFWGTDAGASGELFLRLDLNAN
jgi:hypothetical protein